MARIAIMALEGIEEPSEELVDVDLAATSQVNADISDQQNTIDEAKEIDGTIGKITDSLDSSDITPDSASVGIVKAAVEHLNHRLAYKKKSLISALESYGTSPDGNKKLSKELKIAQEAIRANLKIAQEGLWARFKHGFSLFFTTNDKIFKNLRIVGPAYDSRGPKEGLLVKPGFSKYLNPTNEDIVKASYVITQLEGMNKLTDDTMLARHIDIITKIMEKVQTAKYTQNGGDINTIINEHKRLKEIMAEMDKQYDPNKKGYKEADIEPLQVNEKDKLYNVVEKLLTDDKLEVALDKLSECLDTLDYDQPKKIVTKKQGGTYNNDGTKSVRADEEVTTEPLSTVSVKSNAVYGSIEDIMIILHRLGSVKQAWCHAAVAYIKASTK